MGTSDIMSTVALRSHIRVRKESAKEGRKSSLLALSNEFQSLWHLSQQYNTQEAMRGFGVSLRRIVRMERTQRDPSWEEVPLFLRSIVEHLRSSNKLGTEGIFRVCAPQNLLALHLPLVHRGKSLS